MARTDGLVTGGQDGEDDLKRLMEVQEVARNVTLSLSGDAALADDIAQETGIRFLKRGGRTAKNERITNLGSWSKLVATNIYIDGYRRDQRHQEYLRHAAGLASGSRVGFLKSDAMRDTDLLDTVMLAIRTEIMDLNERDAYLGYIRGELTAKEAAEMVSKSVPTFQRGVLRKHVSVAVTTHRLMQG